VSPSSPGLPSLARIVFATEMKRLLRDRRAFLMAVVLPMLLFPLLFTGMDRLEDSSRRSLEELHVRVVADLGALDPELAARIRSGWSAPEKLLAFEEIEVVDAASLDAEDDFEAGVRELLDGKEVLVITRSDGLERPRIELYYDGSDSAANEGHDRVMATLRDVSASVRAERLIAIVGADPAGAFEVDARDVAVAEDAVGHELGKLLPIVLVLMLISGGSFAALGAFAGEREAGTIETLLVQPVPSLGLALGKFLSVLATACLAMAGNAASFLFCLAMGWGDLPAVAAEGALATNGPRLLLGLALFFPTAVFLSALLCFLSARARSFREGQHYVFPLVLVACVFAALSTQDRVEASWLLALVPVTGSTLVLRDTLAGSFPPLAAALSVVATALWSWFALSRLALTLDAERLFKTRDDDGELAARHVQSRRALAWGVASVALVYIVGGRMQSAHLIGGLMATLWLLVPLLALLAARGTARRSGESLSTVLGLRRPRPAHLVAALALAPAIAAFMNVLFEWQQRILPMPQGMQDLELFEGLGELSPWALVVLLALSPGWNEEQLFRGAILSGLKRDLPAIKVILWQALLFGAVHASIYRFLPTALLGGVLAAVTLRARSLWPAVLLHTAYNACLVLELVDGSRPWLAVGLALGGTALLALGRQNKRAPA